MPEIQARDALHHRLHDEHARFRQRTSDQEMRATPARGNRSGSPRNVWAARVDRIEPLLAGRRLRLDRPVPLVAEVTAAAVAELGLQPGSPIWVALKATEVQVVQA